MEENYEEFDKKHSEEFDKLIQGYQNEVDTRVKNIFDAISNLKVKLEKDDKNGAEQIKKRLNTLADIIGASFDNNTSRLDAFAVGYGNEAYQRIETIQKYIDTLKDYTSNGDGKKMSETNGRIHCLASMIDIPIKITRAKIRTVIQKSK